MKNKLILILNIILNSLYSPRATVNFMKSICLPKKAKLSYFPIFADIEPTIACNLNCVMCHRKELVVQRKSLTMTFEQFKEILKILPYLLKINLQGMGEPFISKDVFKMIKYARDKKIYVSTVTNGMLVTEECSEKILESDLNRIYFSIDSANPKEYSEYRLNGDLEKVKENLKKLTSLRNKKNSKLRIGVWMLLFNSNLDQLIPMIKLAQESGADELIVQSNITYRGKKEWKDLIGKMKINNQDKKVIEIIKEAENFAKNEKFKFSVKNDMGALKPKKESLCQWLWKSIYITSNGNISSCCIIADPKIAYLGNIFSQKFEDIWNGEKYQLLRKNLLKNNIPSYCQECYRNK